MAEDLSGDTGYFCLYPILIIFWKLKKEGAPLWHSAASAPPTP